MAEIISNKYYNEQSVFLPENLLREARRQKNKKECKVPAICLLDPDGDLADYLLRKKFAVKNECWACYHSSLYTSQLNDFEIGIIPCVVGSSYAVLVAEQLFVSGCKLLISVTSAGIIKKPDTEKRFALITSAVRDEGTSYHYLPPDELSELHKDIKGLLDSSREKDGCPFFEATSWTTDAPYRETPTAIENMKKLNVACAAFRYLKKVSGADAALCSAKQQMQNNICPTLLRRGSIAPAKWLRIHNIMVHRQQSSQ